MVVDLSDFLVPLLGPSSNYLPHAPLQGGLPPSPFIRQFQCQFQEEPSAKSIHISKLYTKVDCYNLILKVW